MGANNFVALATIPAGTAQPLESAAVDLYAVVPPNGFAVAGVSVILGGDFEGSIAILGSLDGVNFRPVTNGFVAGRNPDPSRVRSLEFPPQLITDLIRYVKWKVLPNTVVTSAVSITLGGSLNCDCAGGSGFPGYGTGVLPVAAANSAGVSPLAARVDHAHEGVHSNIAGAGISVSGAVGDVTIANTGVLSLAAGGGISVSGATGNITISNTGVNGITSPLGTITIGGTSTNPTLETTFGAAGSLSQIDIGDTASAGVANTSARIDHQHAFPAGGIPPAIASAGSAGVASTPARSDHTHEGVASLIAGSGISVSGGGVGAVTVTNTGVLDIQPNGGAALTGAVDLNSPMISVSGNVVRIDNANTKTLGGAPVSNDIDTEVNTQFNVAKLAAASTTIPIPKAPVAGFEGRRISFQITSRGTSTDTITWTTGAGGYLFALVLGPTLADFNNLLAATPNNGVISIGFQYNTTLNRWLCNAVAGYYV